jgi:hypothetical protein
LDEANGNVKIEMDQLNRTADPYTEQQRQQIHHYYSGHTTDTGHQNDPFWSQEDEHQHQTQHLV